LTDMKLEDYSQVLAACQGSEAVDPIECVWYIGLQRPRRCHEEYSQVTCRLGVASLSVQRGAQWDVKIVSFQLVLCAYGKSVRVRQSKSCNSPRNLKPSVAMSEGNTDA
jgi:hypothetical protein